LRRNGGHHHGGEQASHGRIILRGVAGGWIVLGRSVQGRPIPALRLGDPHASLKAAAVACIHGNEPAGIRVI
jgi:hypothetical protein